MFIIKNFVLFFPSNSLGDFTKARKLNLISSGIKAFLLGRRDLFLIDKINKTLGEWFCKALPSQFITLLGGGTQ